MGVVDWIWGSWLVIEGPAMAPIELSSLSERWSFSCHVAGQNGFGMRDTIRI